jgi:4-amino-4-deoxy-L-arabinose transferase-like glycosyltransferase
MFLGFLLAAALTRLPILHRAVLDWDESLYFLMAAQWRAGHLPYTTIWDNKPIGIYAIFAVFQSVIPGIAAIRVASMVCVGLLAAVVARITEKITQDRAAGLAAGVVLVAASLSNDGLAANTELFMACFTAAAVLAALHRAPGTLVGVLLGLAFMVKYVALFEAPVVGLLLLCERRHLAASWRTAFGLAVGFVVPVALAGLVYAHAGLLGLWWEDSVLSNLRRAASPAAPGALHYALQTQALRWGPLYAGALALIACAARRQAFMAAWGLAGLAGACAARSFYDHYFLQMLPVLCVIAGYWLARLAGRPVLQAVLLLVVLAPLAWAGRTALAQASGPDAPAEAAAALNEAGASSLYVFDTQPVIYALTGLTPPTRYVLPSELIGPTLPAVAGVDPAAEVARILKAQPEYILRRRTPSANENPALIDMLNADLAAHYTLWGQFPGIDAYVIKPGR